MKRIVHVAILIPPFKFLLLLLLLHCPCRRTTTKAEALPSGVLCRMGVHILDPDPKKSARAITKSLCSATAYFSRAKSPSSMVEGS